MRGFFSKLGFGSSVRATPEDPELKVELERYEKLKQSLLVVQKAAVHLESVSVSFAKAVEEMGNSLSNIMLWPDSKCKSMKLFKLTGKKKAIMEDTLTKEMTRITKSLGQKIAYTNALDKGLKEHNKLKAKHDRVLHKIEVLKSKLKQARTEELEHIVDASMLDQHIQQKYSKELSDLSHYENRKKSLVVELREDTRTMIAALRSSHTQMYRYCETTSLSLEKSLLDYLHYSHEHVKEVSPSPSSSSSSLSSSLSQKIRSKSPTSKLPQGLTPRGGKEFTMSTSALKKMHSKDGNVEESTPSRPPRTRHISPGPPKYEAAPPPTRPPRKYSPPKSKPSASSSSRVRPQGMKKSNQEFKMSTSSLAKKHSHDMFIPESYSLYGETERFDDSMTTSPELAPIRTTTGPPPPARVSSSEHLKLRNEMMEASKNGDYDRASVIQELLKAAELHEHKKEDSDGTEYDTEDTEEEEEEEEEMKRKSAIRGRELFMLNVVDNL